MTDSVSFKDLLVKRSSVKGQITRFKNYLDKVTGQSLLDAVEIAELSLKISKLESQSIKYDELQTQIELLNSDNLENEFDERERIEQDFILCLATAKNVLEVQNEIKSTAQEKKRRESLFHDSHSQCGLDVSDGIILPKIQISKYDGSFFSWMQFRDSFTNLIHNNERISDIQKFHYLISYLEGDAARVISNIEVSSANYKDAWQLLYDRYNNKRLLINYHLKSLFNTQPLTRETEGSLRFLVDHITKNLRALANLGQPTQHWDTLIIFFISSKLENNTLVKWEEHRNNIKEFPTLEQFKQFLIDRAHVLESTSRNKLLISNNNNNYNVKPFQHSQSNNNKQTFQTKSYTTSSQHNNQNTVRQCIICDKNHKIYDCPIFKQKSIGDKLSDVSKYKLCSNCLRQGHPVSECRMGPCRQCNKYHNTLLHAVDATKANNAQIQESDSIVSNFSKENSKCVLLSTALIEVSNPTTKRVQVVKALLDSGSESSFISKSLQNSLQLNTKSTSVNVIGIGDSTANKVNERCVVQLNSKHNNYQVNLNCFVMDKLTGDLPKCPISLHSLNIPKNIKLADPNFYQPGTIDLLIGADLFWDVLLCEQKSLGNNQPTLHKSKFGWLIAGCIYQHKAHDIQCNNALTDHLVEEPNIAKLIQKFWELEDVPNASKPIMSENELACESHFLAHTTRLETGRFCVKLPLKDSPECLGDSFTLAKKRLLNLEKRFRRNPSLKIQYSEFIKEYEDLGHLSETNNLIPPNSYFLCHHAVFKMLSESTKIRVVFDGSAPSSSGFSLNDLQMIGPNVQDSLFAILIRARLYKYLLTGDVEKMYRCVNVHPEDRNLQLILWREDESLPLKILKLNTVTYGTSSASFLSTRCLKQIGEECNDAFIKKIIQRDFYVDDLITGSNDKNQLQNIQKSVASELNKGCFKLRKYKTNLPSIFEDSPNISLQENLTLSESSSTLGLGWNPNSDTLHFPINISPSQNYDNTIITKRYIMSNAFKIFDPLGLLSPCIMQAKLMLKKLWQLKVDWDEPVPSDIRSAWIEFSKGLSTLVTFQIPRLVLCDSPCHIEMHTFSDASLAGYGVCIYLKTTNSYGIAMVRLLCSKSKVGPVKPTTVPRLELSGALLAARLCKTVTESLNIVPDRTVHWCDSSVVLGWLKGDASRLKTFVANRVSEIQDTTQASAWRYVPTSENPADLISRGVDASQLQNSSLWWNGPEFLLNNEDDWPTLKVDKHIDLPEVKTVATITISAPVIDFERFSNFSRLQRTMAYVKRFVNNIKFPKNKLTGILTAEELNSALKTLCLISQQQCFPIEYKTLLDKKELSSRSKILTLSPFIDDEGLIRVGGRIDKSNCPYDYRHPILLESSHQLCKLIFKYEHIRNMHAGPQLLLATVRQTVWPIRGRVLARSTVRGCVCCRRVQGKALCPKMGKLPTQRINPDFPFKTVGIDMAGPFYIINRKGRGAKVSKCYLCLFVCLRYKCIHLEAVTDMTKNAFLLTLRRFISRRGRPSEIFSDNGRNFVGACRELKSLQKEQNELLSEFAAQEGIKFTFTPSYAPHFGGIWECGIKMSKYLIKRVMGTSHLTFEEISTLFAQVEAILNSRPLCPMSSSPDDLHFLSPGHYLIGRPLNALPSPALEAENENRLNRYARLEKLRQHFWRRWQKEYLSELQTRTKWRQDTTSLKVGDLVLLCEDSLPPLCWRSGRVTRLYPGPDGISRVADVKTTTGTYRRPLVRLCPLLSDEEDLKKVEELHPSTGGSMLAPLTP